MTYTALFDQIDPDGELQVDTEEAIAGQLFYDWDEYTPYQHARLAIEKVAEGFGRPAGNWSYERALMLTSTVFNHILKWQERIGSGRPHEEDAGQEGKDLLEFILREIQPLYVESA
jgi:hypothetical protein